MWKMCISDLDAVIMLLFVAIVFLLWFLLKAVLDYRNEKRFHYAVFPESKIKKSLWR